MMQFAVGRSLYLTLWSLLELGLQDPRDVPTRPDGIVIEALDRMSPVYEIGRVELALHIDVVRCRSCGSAYRSACACRSDARIATACDIVMLGEKPILVTDRGLR